MSKITDAACAMGMAIGNNLKVMKKQAKGKKEKVKGGNTRE